MVFLKSLIDFAEQAIGRAVVGIEFGGALGFANSSAEIVIRLHSPRGCFSIRKAKSDIGFDEAFVEFFGCFEGAFGFFVFFSFEMDITQLRIHMGVFGEKF